jgi:NAD(P)H-dependent flavin oxidoreductase YrpB (nitropropane dioxygenase family)
MRTPICDLFGIDVPIFAFSHCRDVVAAVSRAGGLGVLGAVAFSPDQLEIECHWIDEHVDGRPYGVDIVMPVKYEGKEQGGLDEDALRKLIPDEHKQFVEQILERYRVPKIPEGERGAPALLGWSDAGGRSAVDVALKHPIKLLVNALGPPPKDVVDLAHAHGVKVAALVGTAAQARKQVEAGVDVIVAQGTEAGGHTGEIATMVLVPEVVDAVAPVPVLAAGGIANGRQAAAGLALGAQGVWTGSVWLTVAEADTNPVCRDKLLAASSRDTVRSRAMTGKPARLLRTAWTDEWEKPESPGTLPMPLQFMLTAEALSRINRYAHVKESRAGELVWMPVGQVVGQLNEVRSVQEVVYRMIDEFVDAVERLNGTLSAAEKS